MSTRILLACLAAASLTAAAACGNTSNTSNTSDTSDTSSASDTGTSGTSESSSHAGHSMPGMDMPAGNGLGATTDGYTLTVQRPPMAGMAMPLTFTIARSGKPVTAFDPEQTKLMHFYLIRDDLTGFQHLHPTMNSSGTWSVTPEALTPGKYRIYTQFVPQADAKRGAVITSRPITVPGKASPAAALPTPSTSTTADGYALVVAGRLKAGTDAPLTITVTKAGKPVADLQPYLDTYAHVTAIHAGDLAFAHLHPAGSVHGDHGGPTLTVHADLPAAGTYRMFIQFQTAGKVHTAAITLSAS